MSTLQQAAKLLFPPVCVACGTGLPLETRGDFCPDCQSEFRLFEGVNCFRCAAPRPEVLPLTSNCPLCRSRPLQFDQAIAVGPYEGLLRHLILSAKRVSGEGVSAALGRLIWERASHRLECLQADVVTSIPMHWTRRVRRQTNSAELIAGVLAHRLGVAYAPQLLRKSRRTPSQTNLSLTERWRNLRGAFTIRRERRLSTSTVLLVDDVLTTGATCSEAARALKQAGADRVVAVIAARSL